MQNRTETSTWIPLLAGDEAEKVREVIDDIRAALREAPPTPPPPGAPPGSPAATGRDASLAGGLAGEGLFFGYLTKVHERDEDHEVLIGYIDKAIDAVAEVQMSDGLYSGFTGIAWAVEHLRDLLMDEDDEDPNEGIDDAVKARLSASPWYGDYDLISGLAGLGVYAAERLPRPAAITSLDSVLARFEELSEERDGGRTWHTPPHLLPEWQREVAPDGYYNLGLAHGVPGVIGVLAEMVAADVARDRAEPLLDAAVTWLLAQKLPEDAHGYFESWLSGQKEPAASRSAWCYGDPGAACSVHLAGCARENQGWQETAHDIMRGVARRPEKLAGVRDAGLCHGSAGLAHILNRFYQATGDDELAEAARFWYRETLALRIPELGIAGYRSFHPDPDGKENWDDDPGFLTGVAGIGLALLAATTSVEPEWDRMMLTSLPLRG